MELLDRLTEESQEWLDRLGGWWESRRQRGTRAWAARLLNLAPGDRVLELQCGPGDGLATLAEHVPDGTVLGIDVRPKRLEVARRRAPPGAGLTRAHAAGLPLAEASLDAVLAVDALPVRRENHAIDELYRVLAPEGRLAIAFTDREAEQADDLTDRLTRTGFQRARRRRSDHGACVVAER